MAGSGCSPAGIADTQGTFDVPAGIAILTTSSMTRRAGLVLAAGFLVAFIGGGARFALGLTLRPVVDEFNWPRSDLGIAVFVYFVVTAAFTYFAGRLADRFSLRLIMGGGIVLSGVGIGLMGLMSAAVARCRALRCGVRHRQRRHLDNHRRRDGHARHAGQGRSGQRGGGIGNHGRAARHDRRACRGARRRRLALGLLLAGAGSRRSIGAVASDHSRPRCCGGACRRPGCGWQCRCARRRGRGNSGC